MDRDLDALANTCSAIETNLRALAIILAEAGQIDLEKFQEARKKAQQETPIQGTGFGGLTASTAGGVNRALEQAIKNATKQKD